MSSFFSILGVTMKKLILYWCIFLPFSLLSQSITKSQVSSLGGLMSDPTGSTVVTHNLGEVIVGRFASENGEIQLGSGFIPSMEIEVLAIAQNGYEYSIFPNPTSESILVLNPGVAWYEYQIFDLNGRLIGAGSNDIKDTINMFYFSSGTYIVTIIGDTGSIGRFKIIKK